MAFNSIQKEAPVVFNLIIINVLMYVAQLLIHPLTEWGALHYYGSTLFKPHQFITCMFLHDPTSLWHIIFNMFTLWMFGPILERFLGSKRFLIFYLICGIGASLLIELTIPFSAGQYVKTAQELIDGMSPGQIIHIYEQEYSMIGASGAIMGVMAAFTYLFPNTQLYLFFIPIPIKAKYIIPLYILYELFGGFYQFKGDNIGHFAHLGGALVGVLLIIYWNKTNRKTMY